MLCFARYLSGHTGGRSNWDFWRWRGVTPSGHPNKNKKNKMPVQWSARGSRSSRWHFSFLLAVAFCMLLPWRPVPSGLAPGTSATGGGALPRPPLRQAVAACRLRCACFAGRCRRRGGVRVPSPLVAVVAYRAAASHLGKPVGENRPMSLRSARSIPQTLVRRTVSLI